MRTSLVAACMTAAISASCSNQATVMTDFAEDTFAGNWHMQASTFYANDIWGCIKMNISVPDAYNKLDMALRKVQMWGLNPTNSGQIHAESYQLNSTTDGVLTYKVLALLDSPKYTVLETDYTTYAIVYECSKNFPYVLNY